MPNYLDKNGLKILWAKIKEKFALKSHTHTKSQITDFPTIPTVYNPTITIKQGTVTKGSFTLNQSSSETITLNDASSGGYEGHYSFVGDVGNVRYYKIATLKASTDDSNAGALHLVGIIGGWGKFFSYDIYIKSRDGISLWGIRGKSNNASDLSSLYDIRVYQYNGLYDVYIVMTGWVYCDVLKTSVSNGCLSYITSSLGSYTTYTLGSLVAKANDL